MQLDPTSEGWSARLDEAFGRAITEAIAEHKRRGHPIYYKRPGVAGIIKEMPDGSCYEVEVDEDGQETVLREVPRR